MLLRLGTLMTEKKLPVHTEATFLETKTVIVNVERANGKCSNKLSA